MPFLIPANDQYKLIALQKNAFKTLSKREPVMIDLLEPAPTILPEGIIYHFVRDHKTPGNLFI